jgi:chromosomal replication initiator protein
MRDIEDCWKRCGDRLRAELGEDVFSSWFGSLKLEAVAAGRAQFSVSTRFLKSWIDSHYQERIVAALEAEIGGVEAIQVSVRSSNPATRKPDAPTDQPAPANTETATRFRDRRWIGA